MVTEPETMNGQTAILATPAPPAEPVKVPRWRQWWPFTTVGVKDVPLVALGYEQVTCTSSGEPHRPGQGTTEIPEGATEFVLQVETASIRYLDDGETVQPGRGMLYPPGAVLYVDHDPRFISVCAEAGAAKVNITFYGRLDMCTPPPIRAPGEGANERQT